MTHFRHMANEQDTVIPSLSSPNPSAFLVVASKHSSSGSMSRFASETRA
jgi:hypothetical protein